MFSRKVLIVGSVFLAFLLVACGGQAAEDEMMEDEMMDEEMMDDEMMDEESMDEEMMDEEAMDEEMMDEEMMDEEMMAEEVTFTIHIENLDTLLAPGVWVVYHEGSPLFVAGEADRGEGLETLAEDGAPSTLNDALDGIPGVGSHGVFNTPVGANEPGVAAPGAAYEFTFTASPGDVLAFATMFVQSNDLFYAPEVGITLFNAEGHPISGDVTAQIALWDAGTEVNEEPGAGPNQAPRQSAPNTGEDEDGVVQIVNDGFTYLDTSAALVVTITADKME